MSQVFILDFESFKARYIEGKKIVPNHPVRFYEDAEHILIYWTDVDLQVLCTNMPKNKLGERVDELNLRMNLLNDATVLLHGLPEGEEQAAFESQEDQTEEQAGSEELLAEEEEEAEQKNLNVDEDKAREEENKKPLNTTDIDPLAGTAELDEDDGEHFRDIDPVNDPEAKDDEETADLNEFLTEEDEPDLPNQNRHK